MNSQNLNAYLNFLGRTHSDLVTAQLVPPGKLMEIYPGSFTKHYELAPGLDLDFWAETEVFEKVHFTFFKTIPSSLTYNGGLDEPFGACSNREMVLQKFGKPLSSKGQFKMPSPMGEVGGWDTYDLTSLGYAERTVTFKYDVAMQVVGVTFALKVTGFDTLRADAVS